MEHILSFSLKDILHSCDGSVIEVIANRDLL